MRLFICLPLPQSAQSALLAAQRALARQGSGNFTRPENLHITLAFLGETENPEGARRAMQIARSAPLPIALEGVGCFGDLYWAGVRLTPELQAAQSRLAAALHDEGFRLDTRPFRPHLTLCRRFRGAGKPDTAQAERALGTPRWTAREWVLMHSHRVNGVLTYRPLVRETLHL